MCDTNATMYVKCKIQNMIFVWDTDHCKHVQSQVSPVCHQSIRVRTGDGVCKCRKCIVQTKNSERVRYPLNTNTQACHVKVGACRKAAHPVPDCVESSVLLQFSPKETPA